MDKLLIVRAILCLFISQKRAKATLQGTVKEYCTRQNFSASCDHDHVIMMTGARYGRLRLGECVTNEFGFLGCHVDVMSHMDSRCSGKRSCAFIVPDDVLHQAQPCPADLTSYLEASYVCVKVESASNDECRQQNLVRTTNHHGYISSLSAQQSDAGSSHCPWVIEASPGQTISVFVYNLGEEENEYLVDVDRGTPYQFEACVDVAVVSEAVQRKTLKICQNDPRKIPAFQSRTNAIDIRFVNKDILKNVGKFLIEYKVTGCSDLETPGDTWVKRDGDTLMVRCNNSAQTWYLTCSDNQWAYVGDIGNCSLGRAVEIVNVDYYAKRSDPFPLGIVFVVAIGVAIGIFLGGLMLSIVVIYNKRRYHHGPESNHLTTLHPIPNYGNRETATWVETHQNSTNTQIREHQRLLDGSVMTNYTTANEGVIAKTPDFVEDIMRHNNDIVGGNAVLEKDELGQTFISAYLKQQTDCKLHHTRQMHGYETPPS